MSESKINSENVGKPQRSEVSSECVAGDKRIKKVSWFAFASVVCGAIGLICAVLPLYDLNGYFFLTLACGFFAAGLILGIIACIIIACSKHLRGYGYAIVSIGLATVVFGTMGIFRLTVAIRAKVEKTQLATYNLRVLGAAMTKYAEDHDGSVPVANQWGDLLMEHKRELSEDNFRHPKFEGSSIAFNENLDSLRLTDIPGDVVLLFEAEGGWNLTGGEQLLNEKNSNRYFVHVLLVNGKIQEYSIEDRGVEVRPHHFMPLRWKP